MHPEGRLKQRDLDGVRAVLNAWDPIGVYQHPAEPLQWPEDEYDCLRWPLVSLLQQSASRLEVAAFLRKELQQHFGVDAPITDDLLNELFAWWAQTHAAGR
jgi:hypothetical protein